MFKKSISIVLLVCIILTTLTFSSCGEIESKNPKRPKDIPEIGTTPEANLDSENYNEIAKNNNFILEFNPSTTDIRLTNRKTKYVWSSEYRDTKNDIISRGEIFTLKYTDQAGAVKDKSSNLDSVADGKYKISYIQDGVKVQYGVGDVGYEIKFPMALSPERYKQYYDYNEETGEETGAFAGSPEDVAVLQDCYELYDFSTEEGRKGHDDAELTMLEDKFPNAVDGPWYYMIADTKTFENVSKLNSVFAKTGYMDTEGLFEADNEGIELPELNAEEFNLSIYYTLTENGLSVRIPEKEIYYNEDYPLESITVLPNMMDFCDDTEGYFLLPDGSGSIMNFNNDKESLRNKSVYVQMYGVDNSRVVEEKTAFYNDAIMPVFGTCVKGNVNKKGVYKTENFNGLFGIIESGETFAGISAQNYEESLQKHNNLKLEFRVNERVNMAAFKNDGSTNDDSKYCRYQFQRYLGDIKFTLNPLSGADATYSGMAHYYSDYLFGKDTANTSAKDYYSTIETIGVINTVEKFMGIEYNTKETLTSFEQVTKIANELQSKGFKNMNVKISGWCNGGYEHEMVDSIDVMSEMGGEEGLKSMYKTLTGKNIGVYPDVDFQNSYVSEGAPKSSFISLTLNGGDSIVSDYDPVDFLPKDKLSKYVLTLDGLTENFNGFMSDYKNFGINSVSFRSIGKEINSNFKEDETYAERQETLNKLVELVKSADKDYKIMGTSGQAAYLKYLDVINEMPIESSGFDKCDYSVPFTSMVLSGHIDYTYLPINLSNNNKKDLLKLIESGAGAYFKITGVKYDKIANTSYDSLYSTAYDDIKDEMVENYNYLSEALDGVYGLPITQHEQIAENVFKTTYSNGQSIYVNYSDKEYSADGIRIEAEGYLKTKGDVE